MVTNHFIGGHELWRWVTPGEQGYQAIENILQNIQGPTIALILTSNNGSFPIQSPAPGNSNYDRFVSECHQLADHLHANSAGALTCYFNAHRMKPQNLMPCYYENLAMQDVMANANLTGKSHLRPGPEQHDLHWLCYPDCYDTDFSHTNAAGDTLMAEAWFHILKKELNGQFDLRVGTFRIGSPTTFQVTGGLPNQAVYMAYSLNGLGSTSVGALSVALDLALPQTSGPPRQTDSQGNVQWNLNIPPNTQDLRIGSQAAQPNWKSNVIERFIE